MRKNFLRLTVILGVLLLMSSCASMMASMDLKSAQKKATEHEYSEAIYLAVSALTRSEGENTEAANLIIEIVNQGDAYYNALVKQYRQPDQDNATARIYRAYEALAEMYNVVSKNNLENFTAGGMNYSVKIKDYTTELDTAREDAGKTYYDAAVRKMGEGTLAEYRTAYANLNFVRSIYANKAIPFNDIDSRMETAKIKGTIDIYIVVANDLDFSVSEVSMGQSIKEAFNFNSDWVESHYGLQVDMAYSAWELANAGQNFLDSKTGTMKSSKGVIDFGREVGADIVIYASFDGLKSDEIKVTNHTDKFSGTSTEGVEYVLDLDWSRSSKQTSLNYSYYVVDVNANKILADFKDKTFTRDIVFYTGTYTLTPDIWSISTSKNFAELLGIKDIVDYRYVNFGNNGWAYRTNYSSSDLELRDKEFYDKGMQIFKDNAQGEVEYMAITGIKKAISAAIEDYI
ncbi:MAG: hypothetical protein WC162_05115 [Sphaerochaetaceae bacterium]